MIYNSYVVYDSVADEYSLPTFYFKDSVARRWFSQVLNNVPDDSKNDFKLLRIGTYDSELGILSNEPKFYLTDIVEEVDDND